MENELADREKDRNSFFGETTNFFRIENWFPVFEQYTFATSYLTATKRELELIQNISQALYSRMLYEGYLKQEVDPNYVQCKDWDAAYFDRIQTEALITAEELHVLHDLEARFDRLLQQQFAQASGVFVKLSTRSPKDAGLYTEVFKPLLADQMLLVARELEQESNGPVDLDVVGMIAHTRALIYSLKVRSGREAVRLLLRSQRASDDMTMMKLLRSTTATGKKPEYKQPLDDNSTNSTITSTTTTPVDANEETEKKQVSIEDDSSSETYNIVVRAWCNELRPELEFRCFVFGRRFTSCTQYYPDCYVPKLSTHVHELELRLKDFVDNNIMPGVPASILNLTIDVAFSCDFSKMWLVEINPPPPSAGTSLLGEWDIAENQKVIRGEGERNFTLRVLNELQPNAFDELPQQSLDVIDKFKSARKMNSHFILCRFIALAAFLYAATYSK
jgi:hypothetical protein